MQASATMYGPLPLARAPNVDCSRLSTAMNPLTKSCSGKIYARILSQNALHRRTYQSVSRLMTGMFHRNRPALMYAWQPRPYLDHTRSSSSARMSSGVVSSMSVDTRSRGSYRSGTPATSNSPSGCASTSSTVCRLDVGMAMTSVSRVITAEYRFSSSMSGTHSLYRIATGQRLPSLSYPSLVKPSSAMYGVGSILCRLKV